MRYRHILISLVTGAILPLTAANAADTGAMPTAPPAGAEAATPQEASPATQGSVARAVFTSGVKDKEPVDTLTTVSNDTHKVYFFTDLRNLSGHMIHHRWEYNGKTMATVEFGVGGPRWRVWSTKTLLPEWTGKWTVSVIDETGNVLDQASFEYTQAKP